MNNEELLVLVDKRDNIIGTVPRSEAHGNPELVHREVTIFLFNSNKETLLGQRSLKKKHAPGKWDNACSGHVNPGEEPKETAERELKE